MPTPPWMISDNESLLDSDEFDSDHNKKVHTPCVNNQRPCIDNWKAEVSHAKPLNEVNFNFIFFLLHFGTSKLANSDQFRTQKNLKQTVPNCFLVSKLLLLLNLK